MSNVLIFCCVDLQLDLGSSLTFENIDNGMGVLFPFWDEGTKMVYIVGKVYSLYMLCMCIRVYVCVHVHEIRLT